MKDWIKPEAEEGTRNEFVLKLRGAAHSHDFLLSFFFKIVLLYFELAYDNKKHTRGFHCDNSMHVHNVL
jgi:hypothetical protein